MPLIPPYVHAKGSESVVALGQGMNYAVAGATALDSSFFEAKGIQIFMNQTFLGVQLEWFKQSLTSVCGNTSGN